MNKKVMLVVLIILFMSIGAVLGIYCYNKLNKKSYCLNLPSREDLSNICLYLEIM